LFAAFGDPENMVYGRNFDWEYSPAVLLFTAPPDGYASVSMVDITYLGLAGSQLGNLTDLPLSERKALLAAPYLPFDGMNERGLAVAMAAVPPGQVRTDPQKETVGSLGIIRKMLDEASDVAEAVSILQRYNIDFQGGPPLHYLLADASGQAVLVEYYQGQMHLIPNEMPWHQATNFLRSAVDNPAGECWRYDRISQELERSEGRLSAEKAIELLQSVSQEGTQWSIVYDLDGSQVHVVMGRAYDRVHTLRLDFLVK
jgi:hypothetical protein